MRRVVKTLPARSKGTTLATAALLVLAGAAFFAVVIAAPQPFAHHNTEPCYRRFRATLETSNDLSVAISLESAAMGSGHVQQGFWPEGATKGGGDMQQAGTVPAQGPTKLATEVLPSAVGPLFHTSQDQQPAAAQQQARPAVPSGSSAAAAGPAAANAAAAVAETAVVAQTGDEEPPVPEPDGVSCVVAPIKKVALLFLTLGPMPHEKLWEEWLRSAEGLLPLSNAMDPGTSFCLKTCARGRCTFECGEAAACSPQCRAALARMFSLESSSSSSASSGNGNGTNALLRRQQLFTIYTHAPPEFGSYQPGSPFEGTLIQNRVATAWGSPSLMLAGRQLLEAAFEDPLNEWFLLLSDTTVPLYPPGLLWQQLMHSDKSKINSCKNVPFDQQKERYSRFMVTPTFRLKYWRKSSQWWMLMRTHVGAVLNDTQVHQAFLKHCRTGYDKVLRRERICVSDEHLVPSLLASRGEENRTTCDGDGATYIDWSTGGSHPKTFAPEEITRELFESMRGYKAPECGTGWRPAVNASTHSFVSAAELAAPATCPQVLGAAAAMVAAEGGVPYAAALLPEKCSLMARKFGQEAAPAVLELFHSCSQGLEVLPCREEGQASQGGPVAGAAASTGERGAATATPVAASTRVDLWQLQLDAQELSPL